MASQPIPQPAKPSLVIPDDLRQALSLRETDTHYLVSTFSGATLFHAKDEINFPWELTRGILDDGKDTTEEMQSERRQELEHDGRKFGV